MENNYEKKQEIGELYQSLAEYQLQIDDSDGQLKSLYKVRNYFTEYYGASSKNTIKVKR